MSKVGENQQSNVDILKGSLSAEDFGILDTQNNRIESIADLEGPVSHLVNADDDNRDDKKGAQHQSSNDNDSNVQDVEFHKDSDVPENIEHQDDHISVGKTDPKLEKMLDIFGQNLKEQGLLDFNPEEFAKAEDKDAYFLNKFKEQKEKVINDGVEEKLRAYKAENLPEEIDELIKLHKEGVPLYSLLEADQRINSLEAIKTADIESDTDLQKDILTEHLRSQGLSKEKIEAKIKRHEDLGTLKEESLDSFDALKTLEKQAKETMIKAERENKLKNDAKRDASIADLTSKINSKEEIIPGFKLKPEDRKVLIDGITKTIGYDKQGRPYNAIGKMAMDDPDHNLKVAYFSLILKGDLKNLKSKTETAVTRKFKDVLDNSRDLSNGSTGSTASTTPGTRFNKDVARAAFKALRREH